MTGVSVIVAFLAVVEVRREEDSDTTVVGIREESLTASSYEGGG